MVCWALSPLRWERINNLPATCIYSSPGTLRKASHQPRPAVCGDQTGTFIFFLLNPHAKHQSCREIKPWHSLGLASAPRSGCSLFIFPFQRNWEGTTYVSDRKGRGGGKRQDMFLDVVSISSTGLGGLVRWGWGIESRIESIYCMQGHVLKVESRGAFLCTHTHTHTHTQNQPEGEKWGVGE